VAARVCPQCGGPLTLEASVCPWCSTPVATPRVVYRTDNPESDPDLEDDSEFDEDSGGFFAYRGFRFLAGGAVVLVLGIVTSAACAAPCSSPAGTILSVIGGLLLLVGVVAIVLERSDDD
jgi:hypothetical protein